MKNTKDKINGITLISLIIVIIFLLILGGITIAQLTGENGLFQKVKLAKEEYSIQEAKEKLELAIMDLRVEQESKGEELTKENLPKMNNGEIDVREIEKFPVVVICGNYEFNIDENYNVIYKGEANSTIITYTTEPEGYTNQDQIDILIKVKNAKGIKTIQNPEGEKIICNGKETVGIDYTVTKNGIYTFVITDNEQKIVNKDIVIDRIDKLKPKSIAIKVEDIYLDEFTINVEAEDEERTEESTKSGIGKYEYYVKKDGDSVYTKYVNENKKFLIEGLIENTQYEVYVIAYDRAGNDIQSDSIIITTLNNPYPPLTNITFNEANATQKILEYPILTLDGMMNCSLEPNIGEEVTLEIISPKREKIKYYYSLDGGISWNEYTDIVKTEYKGENLIQVKTIYKGKIEKESEVKVVKKYFKDLLVQTTGVNSLNLVEAYDKDFNSYMQFIKNTYFRFEVYPDCWGKYISIIHETSDGSGYGVLSLGVSYENYNNIASGYIWKLAGYKGSGGTKSILIPESTRYGALAIGTANGIKINVYEIWCSRISLNGKIYSNDNLPEEY